MSVLSLQPISATNLARDGVFHWPFLPPRQTVSAVHVLLALNLAIAAVAWEVTLFTGWRKHELEAYLLLLGLYGLLSASFVFSRTSVRHFQLFDIPIFLTVFCFGTFGLAPLRSFLFPRQLHPFFHGDYAALVEGLFYVMLGMTAFWIGCHVASAKARPKSNRPAGGAAGGGDSDARVLVCATAFFLGAFVTRFYMLQAELYSYTQSLARYFLNLGSAQILIVVSQLGTFALVMAAIERYSRPADTVRKLLFIAVLLSECFWGLVSGMKGALLVNLLLVALTSSLVNRRLCARWMVGALVGLIAIYPLYDRYRALIRTEGVQVRSLTAAGNAGIVALRRTVREEAGAGQWVESGLRKAVARLDLLESFALAMTLHPEAAQLQGDERLWMLPLYPLVPRFLWPGKPVLDKGRRFSVLLGIRDETSTAITYPGDLYLTFGLPGILVGMLVLGLLAQSLISLVSGAQDKRKLFLYAALFLAATNIENDVFAFWSGLIKSLAVLMVVAWVAYGTRPRVSSWPPPLPIEAIGRCES